MSQYFGMKRDEGVSRAESAGNTGIYPDTEIFASMLSTITRRTSSRERRAIFQATAGYVHIYTYMYMYVFANSWDTRTRRREENRLLCVGTWNTFLTRSVRVRAHAIVTIHEFREICRIPILYYHPWGYVDWYLRETDTYRMARFVPSSYLRRIKDAELSLTTYLIWKTWHSATLRCQELFRLFKLSRYAGIFNCLPARIYTCIMRGSNACTCNTTMRGPFKISDLLILGKALMTGTTRTILRKCDRKPDRRFWCTGFSPVKGGWQGTLEGIIGDYFWTPSNCQYAFPFHGDAAITLNKCPSAWKTGAAGAKKRTKGSERRDILRPRKSSINRYRAWQ